MPPHVSRIMTAENETPIEYGERPAPELVLSAPTKGLPSLFFKLTCIFRGITFFGIEAWFLLS